MKRDPFIELILQNAQSINKLKEEASPLFISSWNDLAFPGGLANQLELLKKHDPAAIEKAITYLKADPYHFRSGYIKQEILTRLKQAPLTRKQIVQLQDILLDVIQRSGRRENQEYYRLAAKIADAPFRARVQEILQSSQDPEIIKRAQQIIGKL